MAHILYYGTHGSDEPTRAVLPFHMAKGALEAGHTAEIALIGDATFLMKDAIAKEVKGVAGRQDQRLRRLWPHPWGDGRRSEG